MYYYLKDHCKSLNLLSMTFPIIKIAKLPSWTEMIAKIRSYFLNCIYKVYWCTNLKAILAKLSLNDNDTWVVKMILYKNKIVNNSLLCIVYNLSSGKPWGTQVNFFK